MPRIRLHGLALTVASVLLAASVHAATLAQGEAAFHDRAYDKAGQILLPMANGGSAEAQYWVGTMHAQGRGMRSDARAAAEWYQKAAEQGHAAAAFSLGFMYYTGSGEGSSAVAADAVKARRWLTRAADAGHAMAQAALGEMYYAARGGARDVAKAYALSLAAAEAGITAAQHNVGLMSAAGEGTPQDRVAALKWFTLLAAKGYPGALWNRLEIIEASTAAEVREAERLAAAFKPKR